LTGPDNLCGDEPCNAKKQSQTEQSKKQDLTLGGAPVLAGYPRRSCSATDLKYDFGPQKNLEQALTKEVRPKSGLISALHDLTLT